MVKLAAAGVGGFVAGYLVRTVQGYFSKWLNKKSGWEFPSAFFIFNLKFV
jgi:hypothetical protein